MLLYLDVSKLDIENEYSQRPKAIYSFYIVGSFAASQLKKMSEEKEN